MQLFHVEKSSLHVEQSSRRIHRGGPANSQHTEDDRAQAQSLSATDYVRVISIVCHFVATSKPSKPCRFWHCFSTILCCGYSYSRGMGPSTSFRRARMSGSTSVSTTNALPSVGINRSESYITTVLALPRQSHDHGEGGTIIVCRLN